MQIAFCSILSQSSPPQVRARCHGRGWPARPAGRGGCGRQPKAVGQSENEGGQTARTSCRARLEHMKAALTFAPHLLQAGTKPYKHKVFGAFYPVFPPAVLGGAAGEVEASHSKKVGRMINSYNGKELARSTSVTHLVKMFTTGKVQCSSTTLQHQAELAGLIAELKAMQAESGATGAGRAHRTKMELEAAAQCHMASVAAGSPAAVPPPPAHPPPPGPGGGPGSNRKRKFGSMDKFVVSGGMGREQAQALLDGAAIRLVAGEGVAYNVMESMSLIQYATTCFDLGRKGFSLSVAGRGGGGPGPSPMTLHPAKRGKLAGSLLQGQFDFYRGKLEERIPGVGGVGHIGYGATTDATTKFLKGVVNHAFLLPPMKTEEAIRVVYWDLADTRGVKTKGNDWQANDLHALALSRDNPFDAGGMYYANLDGACRHAFEAIEHKFFSDPQTSNLVC